MNIELRDKWIKALRSGKYDQTQSRLKTGYDDDLPSYCCLGVLCEVAGVEIPQSTETLDGHEQLKAVRDELGLGEYEAIVNGAESMQQKLALMNDSDGLSFAEIADWIEANIK